MTDQGASNLEVGGEVAAGVLSVLLGMQSGDPALAAFVSAAAQPVLNAATQAGLRELSRRRAENVNLAVELGAQEADLEIDELVHRLLSEPRRTEIFRLGLLAAANTSYEAKARAVAKALVTGAIANDGAKIDLEPLFLRAMHDLDPPHILLLGAFNQSSSELGLGTSTEPMLQLNTHQVELAFPDRFGDALDALLATLERHGLLRRIQGGGPLGGGPSMPSWAITPLGEFVLDRLRDLGED